MKKIVLFTFVACCFSTTAFARWPGAHRPPEEPKNPVDAPHAAGRISGDTFEVTVKVANDSSDSNKNCDYYASAVAKNVAGDRMQIEAFNSGLLKARRSATWMIAFEGIEFGNGYKVKRESLRTEAACLWVADPNQVPDQRPHESCDPSEEKCGWTCQSSQQSPQQCANPNQDWNPNQDGPWL